MKELNIDAFDVMPRATEHIAEQIALIKTLVEK
jgi:cysteinyl-tRNA synthetase